jgi:hypothetical protein
MKTYFNRLFLISSSLAFIFISENVPVKAQLSPELSENIGTPSNILKSSKTVKGSIHFPKDVKPAHVFCNNIEVKIWEDVSPLVAYPGLIFKPVPQPGKLLSSTKAEINSQNSNFCIYTLLFIPKQTIKYVLEARPTIPSNLADSAKLAGTFDPGENVKMLNITIRERLR